MSDDMFIENKGNLKICKKSIFANNVNCPETVLEKLDSLSELVKSKVFKSKCASKFVGNDEKKYCGRCNGEKNIWVGAFFDTDIVELKNKLAVGFCVYDSTQSKPKYPKEQYIELNALHAAGYDYEVQYSAEDGGYWYYVLLDDLLENFDVDKIFKSMKTIIETVNAISRLLKNKNDIKPASLWHRYFSRIITFASILILLCGSILCGKICKKNYCEAVLFESTERIITETTFVEDCPCCCELPCKTIEKNVNKKLNLCSLFVLLILSAGTLALIVVFIKDDSGLRFAKLDELHSIKSEFLNYDCKDSDQKIEERLDTFEKNGEWEKTNKSVITKSSTKADLLKHYMTCVTEI